ncbi:HD domain-containing protein [Methanosphaerula palustris]|uniref:HD domain-containing protein n=1 Tax=Methanosphaerula palustris TaxID=475088 RepID=UPI0001849104|nr:HD domain-containing protein [Methanosphaerula palustris]
MSEQPGSSAGILSFAASHHRGSAHDIQVAAVATSLFDELQMLHHYAEPEWDLLWAACILHDIGWSAGRKGHHKLSCDLILRDRTLSFDENQRLLVALIARYHRRALPDPEKHPLYGGLSGGDQKKVCWLAALIRVADELDTAHASLVREVRCRIERDQIVIQCSGPVPDQRVMASRMHKLDLLTRVTEKTCSVTWKVR